MRKLYILWLFFLMLFSCHQNKRQDIVDVPQIQQQKPPVDSITYCQDQHFNQAFKEIRAMLGGKTDPDFKRAAFLVEWGYNRGNLDYTTFCGQISTIAGTLKAFIKERGVERYKTAGNFALFEYFTKPNKLNRFKPLTYDFDDFYGKKDLNNTYVTKLLQTHKGQCRSMPMLYKILSDEIGAKSYLALGPNHMYIKHLDEQGKWVNIELTNGHFSSDAWMISSMDISAEAIKKGVYMKDLSQQESISHCLSELGSAHQRRYGDTDFALLCFDETLKYFPASIGSLMGKYNVMRSQALAYMKKHGKTPTPWLINHHAKFKAVGDQIEYLGYHDMSPEKYQAWLASMEAEKAKLNQAQ